MNTGLPSEPVVRLGRTPSGLSGLAFPAWFAPVFSADRSHLDLGGADSDDLRPTLAVPAYLEAPVLLVNRHQEARAEAISPILRSTSASLDRSYRRHDVFLQPDFR
jgi:hypothetical protein